MWGYYTCTKGCTKNDQSYLCKHVVVYFYDCFIHWRPLLNATQHFNWSSFFDASSFHLCQLNQRHQENSTIKHDTVENKFDCPFIKRFFIIFLLDVFCFGVAPSIYMESTKKNKSITRDVITNSSV
jgi:hypothetical protein